MDQPRQTIRINPPDERERRRRRRELWLAGGLFLLVVVLSVVELKFLGVNVYLFLALFNLNFIFLLVVLLLVVRNGVKLMLERRRNVLGARLRSRLVLAFISLSLIPTVLMYLVSVQFVQTSVEYWFNSQVGSSMEQALEVGESVALWGQERLELTARNLAQQLPPLPAPEHPEGSALLQDWLATQAKANNMVLLGVLDPEQRDLAWAWTPRFEHAWRTEMSATVDWGPTTEGLRFWSRWWPGAGEDFIIGVLPLDGGGAGPAGYLVLGKRMGSGLLARLDMISRGVEEYRKLNTLKQPLKVALFFIMGVLALLIIFGAMWFGFRLAKELSAPILALAEGTERIARGDLSVRLEDNSRDELGLLVRSFNRMAADLEAMRQGLTEANLQLEGSNEALAERGRYIEAVLDNIAAGVVSLDAEGRITTVNKAASAMLGMDGKFLMGLCPQDLFSGPETALMEEARTFVAENPGQIWERQLTVRMRGLERTVLVNVVALGQGEPAAGLVAVFEDITELQKMQRMAAWREVARRIAHEIKNPLTPIKLSAQRLQRKFGAQVSDKAFGECIELIVGQVEHLQQMVQEFSAFAKLPEMTPRPGRLEPLLQEVTALFRHSHAAIRWELDLEPLPELLFDPEGLRRGCINILTNAVEALQPPQEQDGAPLTPEASAAPLVRITARHDQALGLVRLEVYNNGPRLSPEESSRLFEPYFSRKKGGTGLGLTILKSIVTDHRGYVRARSPQEGGVLVVVELPVPEKA